MADDKIARLNSANFEEAVIESGRTSLVFFGAARCNTCKQKYPIFESLAGEFANKLTSYQVDVDDDKTLAQRMRLKGIPTIILFKGGMAAKKMSGILPKSDLKSLIESLV